MGVKKAKTKAKKALKTVGKAIGLKGGSSGGRKKRGPAYWANKVMVEKLKKRFNKLKYGSMR